MHTALEAKNFKIKAQANLVSGEGLSFDSQGGAFSLHPHVVEGAN
jgi:hypothetical protein